MNLNYSVGEDRAQLKWTGCVMSLGLALGLISCGKASDP